MNFLEKRNVLIFAGFIDLIDVLLAYLTKDMKVFILVSGLIFFVAIGAQFSVYIIGLGISFSSRKRLFSFGAFFISLPILVFILWIFVEKIFFGRIF